jgi:hypothetical protein
MQVNELTVEQLKALIRETVKETIEEFLTNPDANQTISENLRQELLAIQHHRKKAAKNTYAAEEIQSMVTEKEETPSYIPPHPTLESLSELDPWTQNLIGVIRLESENPQESYVNYLQEKYS